MRALVILNPAATNAPDQARSLLQQHLGEYLTLDFFTSTHAGQAQQHIINLLHSTTEKPTQPTVDLFITVGGDGTVNEVVCGMLHDQSVAHATRNYRALPALAVLPGGSANVFARALGFSNNFETAIRQLAQALAAKSHVPIGVGRANEHWFVINTGLGLDARVIATMEQLRKRGKRATPIRYFNTVLAEYFAGIPNKPSLTVQTSTGEQVTGIYLTIVLNTSPWTYFGAIPIDPLPHSSFFAGLDLFAARSRSPFPAIHYRVRAMFRRLHRPGKSGPLVLHDASAFTVTSDKPIPWQVDGEAVGNAMRVDFQAAPAAISTYHRLDL